MKRLLLALTLASCFMVPTAIRAQENAFDEAKFQSMADRYHSMIRRTPKRGTAFDMLYRHYLDAGKLDDLVAFAEGQVQEKPDLLASHMTVGLVYERLGRVEESLRAVKAAAKLGDEDYYPHFLMALLETRLHQYDEAVASLEAALKRSPDRVILQDIYKRLGRLHLMQDRQDEALKAWSQLAEKFPDDQFATLKLAELLAEEEQYDEAIKRYEQIIEQSKDDPYQQLTSQIEIGQLQVRQGKLDSALKTFEKSLTNVKPDSWQAIDIRRRIEEIFVRSEDLSGLANYYERRVKRSPDDLESMTQLAVTLARLKRSDDAIAKFNMALTLAPTRQDIREKLIAELTQLDRFADAITQTQILLKRDPTNIDYLRQLGMLHLQASDDTTRVDAEQQALAAWSLIPSQQTQDALASIRAAEYCRNAAGIGSRMTSLGDTNRFQSEFESTLGQAAMKFYRQAVTRAPNVAQYHEYLGEFLFSVGKVDEAVDAWNQLAAPPNDSVENLKRLSEVLLSARFPDAAIAALDRAIAKESNRYDLHKLAVELFSNHRDYESALEHVSMMEKHADSPFFEEQALVSRVETYVAANMLPAESAALRAKIEAGDASARDHWLASMMALAERKPYDAVKFLESALATRPNDGRLIRLKADAHRLGGDLRGATEQYRELAKIEPKNRTTHLKEVVSIELEIGNYESAKATAHEILRYAPASSEAVQLLADVHFRSGNHEEGLAAFRRAVRTDPRNAEIRMALARRLIESQNTNEALEHLWRAFELSDTSESKLGVIGELAEQHALMDRSQEMIDRLQRMRRDQEDSFSSTLFLVEAYTRSEDYISARSELNVLLTKRPNDVQVLGQLVALSERLGDLDSATTHQEKIVSITNSVESSQRLAGYYEKLGRSKEANELWLKFVDKNPGDSAMISAIERAISRRELGQAIALGERELAKQPDDWRFAYRLMLAYWHADNLEQATMVAQRIINYLPNTKYDTKTTSGRTTNRSWYNLQPAVVARVYAPSQVRAQLGPQANRSQAWQPRQLAGAQLFATILLSEVATRNGQHDQFVAELKERSKNDLTALRQLNWVTFATSNSDVVGIAEEWVKRSPNEAEARLAAFVEPFQSRYSQIRSTPDKSQFEALLKQSTSHYDWLKEHRPDLSASIAISYIQLLSQFGKRDEAIKVATAAINNTQQLAHLAQSSYLLSSLNDADLFATLLARAEVLMKTSPSSGQNAHWDPNRIMQNYLQASLRGKNWDNVVDAFDRFLTMTHPAFVSNVRLTTTSSATQRTSPRTTSRNSKSKVSFPVATAWIDANRMTMIRTVHNALKSDDETGKLIELTKKRITVSEGLQKQCWQMAQIHLLWLDGEVDEVLKQADEFLRATPGIVESRYIVALVHGQVGDSEFALDTIKDIHIPFGEDAKTLEQLRLALAERVEDKETVEKTALRLFGMRLTSSEQTALAKTMSRIGLSTRSEMLMKRAVRTASNQPAELFKLLNASQGDQARSLQIARMILRQVPRPMAGRPTSSSNYRQQALKVFKQFGELDKSIEQAEEQLAAAPKSATLLDQLHEFYTAAGRATDAEKMTDRILAARPGDADLHYAIANTLFRANKFAEGVERMKPVWKHNPQIALQRSSQLARYYQSADKMDLLAQHIRELKGHPAMKQAPQLASLIKGISSSNNKNADDTIKVYEAALELIPAHQRVQMSAIFGQFLVRNNRKLDAYQLYNELLITASPQYPRASLNSYPYLPTQFFDLTDELNKNVDLRKQIMQVLEKATDWKAIGQLYLAILDKRANKEEPLHELGERYLSDEGFAKELVSHEITLRQELYTCSGEPPLRTVLKLLKRDDLYQQIAEVYIRLNEKDQAYVILMEALDQPSDATQGNLAIDSQTEKEIRRRLSIADALRNTGFELDYLGVYGEVFSQLPEFAASNYTRRSQLPRAASNYRRSIAKLIRNSKREATLEELTKRLKANDGNLSPFFAIADPPSKEEKSRYSSRSTPASSGTVLAKASSQLLPVVLNAAHEQHQLDEISTLIQAKIDALDKQAPRRVLDRLISMQVMTDLAANKTSPPSLTDWSERVAQKPQLATYPETWLIALMAIESEANRKIGIELITSVSQAATSRGDSARQTAALAAISRFNSNSLEAVDNGTSKREPK